MLFFKKILTSELHALTKREQRLSTRYPVGEKYPVQAMLRIDAQRREVRLLDLSCGGASVALDGEHPFRRGQTGQISLTLGEDTLSTPCRITHVRQINGNPACGLEFEFDAASKREAYLQLVEPVALATSLTLVNPAKVEQPVPGLRLEQYEGTPPSSLRVWRRIADREISAFEFQLAEYLVRWSSGMAELELIRAASKRPLSEAQRNEVTWLFHLAVPNLSKRVAPDVRGYLQSLAGD